MTHFFDALFDKIRTFFRRVSDPEYGRDYNRLYDAYRAMRAGADEREEEMTADMDKLTDENDYLKSELARLRIQYDRAKEQLSKTGDELCAGLTEQLKAEREKAQHTIDYLERENQALADKIDDLAPAEPDDPDDTDAD